MIGSVSIGFAQPQPGKVARQSLQRSNDAPDTASAEAREQTQTAFETPVNNKGAFTYSIPIQVPAGIPGMTPDLALSYSSLGSVGIAGVGWDLPYPAISVDTSDGFRPGSIADDLERYPPDVAVERYVSDFGKIAVVRDTQDYETSTRTYVIEPHADQKVEPIADEQGRYYVGGDKAAWLITTKDGTKYRYGYSDQASLYRDEGDPETERKVAWLLDQVEDRHGNLMRYYYEEYPNRQTNYRHPVLRAIAYGIPARNPSVDEAIVILFDYIESPWKRFTYELGTRVDQAFLLDRVCGFANAVIQSVSFSNEQGWDVLNADQPTGNMVPAPCLELEYDFESAGDGYSGRPLLSAVQEIAPDGERRPPWRMTYTDQDTSWQSVYADALSQPGTWTPPVSNELDQGLQYATHDLEHMAADVSGDGVLDVISGRADGGFDVYLGGITGLESEAPAEVWPNPLLNASPVGILATENQFGETTGSACWYKADFHLGWEPPPPCPDGQGCLGYAESLTRLPEDYWTIFTHNWNEREALSLPLGAFQFLRSSHYGPYPAFAKKDVFSQAKTIDQLESFGARTKSSMEIAFDFRTGECRDFMDQWEIDHCWNAGPRRDGMLGADHDCLDFSGARWFTDTGLEDSTAGRSYSSVLWEPRDMDADGIVDLVFGAHVIAQRDDGTQRDFSVGANDWYWARGNGQGWEPPLPWRVPPKDGAKLGLGSEVDFVYGTEMLSNSVSSTATQAPPPLSIGVSSSVLQGFRDFSPGDITKLFSVHGMGIPRSKNAIAMTALGIGARDILATLPPRTSLVVGNLMQAASIVQSGPAAILPQFTVASHGSNASWWLPVVGDVLAYLNTQSDIGESFAYQGLMDLNGDGREDLVSARWDAGSAVNALDRWLFYRNNGSGFDDPTLFRFAEAPPAMAYVSGALSGSINMTFRKRVFDGGPQDLIFGVDETYYALVDLNGDGLGDYVDAHNWEELDDDGNPRQTWWVHFNEGNRFGSPVKWVFEGDWDSVHGPSSCSYVHGQPRIAKNVFGNPTYANGGRTYTRAVQGLLDINGDGMLDYWYEEPYLTDGPGSSCGHLVSTSGGFGGGDGLRPYVEPYQLKRRLLVRLNTGNGFGLPIEWVGNDGYALSGGDVDVLITEVPAEQRSATVLGTGDFDNDGALELAARDRYRDATEDPDDDPSRFDWKLYDLAEPNADVLAAVVNPTGGRLEVTYKPYVQPADSLPMIPWVVDRLRITDFDPTHLDVNHTYTYERAVWDQAYREFRGFERIYETSEDGYTLSRYYVNKGFEGRLYCREVRALDNAQRHIGALVASHADAWAQAQTTPAGYTLPVAVGRPLGGVVGPLPWPVEDEQSDPDPPNQSGGSVADTHSPWGPIPADDPPDEDTDEGLTWEADGPAPPEPADYPSDSNQQWGYDAGQNPPLDTGLTGEMETPDRDDTPPGDWWDLPIYESCPPGGSRLVDGVLYYCEGDEIPVEHLSCGDADDPGIPLEHQYFIWGDGSTIQGLHAPKLWAGVEHLFDQNGLNPRITSWHNEIDALGNVVLREEFGDDAITGDELTITREYASSTDPYLVDFPCHERHVEGTSANPGDLLQESWTGYDGGAADGTCTPVTQGNATELKRAVSSAESIIESFAYNQEGLIWRHENGKGHVTTSIYAQRYPWLKVAALNPVSAYDGPKILARFWIYYGTENAPATNFGRLYREVNYDGAVTEYDYDGFDRTTTVIRPLDDPQYPGITKEYVEWDQVQEPAKVVERSLVTSNLYAQKTTHLDGWQRTERLEVTAPDNQSGCVSPRCWAVGQEKEYDLDGRVVESRLPHFSNEPSDDLRVLTRYDLLGRMTRVAGPSGAQTVTAYDRAMVTVEDADGIVVVTEQDARGNPRYTHRYTDNGATLYATTEHVYDPLGRLEQILDAHGNEWRFEYDLLGRTILEHDPNAGDKVLAYDANGNLAVSYDARYATQGLATQYYHDPLDRPIYRAVMMNAMVTGIQVSGGDLMEENIWAYDVDPGLLPDATITSCAGSWQGRLSRVATYRIINGARVLVSRKDYCYDDRGRISEEHRTIHGGHLYTFSYSYNQADTVTQAVYPDGDRITYEYDASGNLVGISSDHVGRMLDGTDFSAGGRPVARRIGTGNISQRYCYEPGESGFRKSETVTGQSTTSLACDGTLPTGPFQYWATYEYTSSGSDRLVSRNVDGAVAHSYAYQYDGLGRLLGETYDGATISNFACDEIGNLTSLNGVSQTYGDAARSTNNAGPNAILSTSSGTEFVYDPAGNVRLIQRGGSRYRIISDARNLPRMIRANGQLAGRYLYDESGARVKKESGGIETRYIGPYRESNHRTETFYPGIGVKVTDLTGAHALYYTLRDPLGSTVMTLNTAGNPVQTVGYEPYGKIRYETVTKNGYDDERLFNAKEREAAFPAGMDIYDFGPRLYFANVGRWLSVDSTYADGINRYRFVRNDPISYSDPDGHQPHPGPDNIWFANPNNSLLIQLPDSPGAYEIHNGNLLYVGSSSWSIRQRLSQAFYDAYRPGLSGHRNALYLFSQPGTHVRFLTTAGSGLVPRWLETIRLHHWITVSNVTRPRLRLLNSPRALNPMSAINIAATESHLGNVRDYVTSTGTVRSNGGYWARMGMNLGRLSAALSVGGGAKTYFETLNNTGSRIEAGLEALDEFLMPYMPVIILDPCAADPNCSPPTPAG